MVLFLGTSGSRHGERYQQGHRPRARGRSPRQAPAVFTVSGIILIRWIKSTCHRFWRILALPIVVLWLWLSIVYLSILASKGNTEESAASRNLWTWCTSWLEQHSFATSENSETDGYAMVCLPPPCRCGSISFCWGTSYSTDYQQLKCISLATGKMCELTINTIAFGKFHNLWNIDLSLSIEFVKVSSPRSSSNNLPAFGRLEWFKNAWVGGFAARCNTEGLYRVGFSMVFPQIDRPFEGSG